MWEKLLQWDRDIFIYLNGLGFESFDGFWSIITEIYTWIPLFLFFIYLLFKYYPKQEALLKVFSLIALVIFITLLTHWTKTMVARLRPNNDTEINTFIRILKTPTDYSFFSGHASSSFAVTILIFLFLRKKFKWSFLFFIWPFLFCLSRIYVGVHYPMDIFFGAMVGILSGQAFFYGYHRVLGKQKG